jgi:hypothetical protein
VRNSLIRLEVKGRGWVHFQCSTEDVPITIGPFQRLKTIHRPSGDQSDYAASSRHGVIRCSSVPSSASVNKAVARWLIECRSNRGGYRHVVRALRSAGFFGAPTTG